MNISQKQRKPELIVGCLFFDAPGPQNTRQTLERAAVRAKELNINTVLVATTSGETACRALEYFHPGVIVAVTHSYGFVSANTQELKEKYRKELEKAGVRILTCQHAFGGVGRAVRKKLGTYEIEEIIAYTLRIFGQGVKVAIEISLMAADAGFVKSGEPCLAIGGSGTGADTAILLQPANSQTFFDTKIMEILAKPR